MKTPNWKPMRAELQKDLKSHLRAMPLFSALKDPAILALADYAVVKSEKKNTILFSPDSPNDKFYIILSGWVKLFRETMSGDEAILDVLTTGNFFGEIGLAGSEGMPYGAEVIDDASIIVLPRFLLAEEVMRNSLFGLSVLQSLTRQRTLKDMEIEHRTVQTAPQRIGCFLLKFCTASKEQRITLHLPYEKSIIAARLGMTPETFSRALNQLKTAADISVNGSSVTINNLKQLTEFTCSACSSSFPCEE